ncbi:MAG: Crp/Fnr family transcriptional regulator [Chloroflexi bacterium]|nr:Crp/Fnr family transcriptional regulator [Chloroflexota bacterium]
MGQKLEVAAQVKQILSKSPLSELPSPVIDRLLVEAQRIDVPRNTALYNTEGNPRCALILSGLIRLFMASPDGRQVTVRYARSAELIGLAEIISGPSPVSAQVLTDAKLLLLDGNSLAHLAQTEPRAGWIFAGEITLRLYDTLQALAANTFGTLRQRVARHLLDLAASSSRTTQLVATINQQELADAVGSVRPVVARILRDLRAEGLIETTRDGIALLDAEALVAETWAESV